MTSATISSCRSDCPASPRAPLASSYGAGLARWMPRLDHVLPKIDNAARQRHVSLDLNRLDGLLETFYKRAIENVDAQAGLLCVKIMERKAAMLGLDSP